jgi:hypothetical protein
MHITEKRKKEENKNPVGAIRDSKQMTIPPLD